MKLTVDEAGGVGPYLNLPPQMGGGSAQGVAQNHKASFRSLQKRRVFVFWLRCPIPLIWRNKMDYYTVSIRRLAGSQVAIDMSRCFLDQTNEVK